MSISPLDATARVLRARVAELMSNRPDLSRGDIGAEIQRSPGWLSELLSGVRTTNDLRLVVQLAELFGVPVGYLIGEKGPAAPDAALLTLLSAWPHLEGRDRAVVLSLAVSLRNAGYHHGDATLAESTTASLGEAHQARRRSR